jgi:hypothetical protein
MIGISQAREVLRRAHALRGSLAAAQRRARATASSAPTAPARRRSCKILAGDEAATDGSGQHPGEARARRPAAGPLPRRRADHPRSRDDGRRRRVGCARGARAHRRPRRRRRRTPRGSRGHAADSPAATRSKPGRRRPRGARHPDRLAPRAAVDALRRLQAARPARASAHRRAGRRLARRADQPPRHPLDPLAREVPRRVPRVSRSSSRTTSASSTTSPRTSSTSTTRPSRPYTGNYSAFVVEKAGARERLEAEIARAEKIIAEKRAFVERFGAKATKAKQAQSRLKQIERIEVAELKASSRRRRSFASRRERASGRDVLEVEAVSKAYGDKRSCATCRWPSCAGEKVAVIGPTASASRRSSRS